MQKEITKEKMNEVYYLIPFFVNELDIADFDKQKQHYSTGGEDQAKLKFRNKSIIDIVSTTDAARGGRCNRMSSALSATLKNAKYLLNCWKALRA